MEYQEPRPDVVRIARPYNDVDIEADVLAVLRSGKLVQGEKVRQFEKSLSEYLGCKHVVAVNSGTAALHSSILAVKLSAQNEKDEVITTPFSFAATANAALHAGCKPVFADIDSETFNIDPEKIEEKVSSRTLSIEPVDVFGLPSDLDKINAIASDSGAIVVEDAAEAIGAKYRGRKIGSVSPLTCFSTYATKNLHSAEGGFVSTDNDSYAESLRLIRNQGQASRYNQTELGFNFRMPEVSAVIGLHQLARLDELNKKRFENAQYLKQKIESNDCLSFQKVNESRNHAWYMFSVLLDEKKARLRRDEVVQKLKSLGIEADVAWPTPIHLQPYYQRILKLPPGSFPNAERICKSIFQLPVQPFLGKKELDRIVIGVNSVLS